MSICIFPASLSTEFFGGFSFSLQICFMWHLPYFLTFYLILFLRYVARFGKCKGKGCTDKRRFLQNALNVSIYENDIAILKLESPELLKCEEKKIWPACLPNGVMLNIENGLNIWDGMTFYTASINYKLEQNCFMIFHFNYQIKISIHLLIVWKIRFDILFFQEFWIWRMGQNDIVRFWDEPEARMHI